MKKNKKHPSRVILWILLAFLILVLLAAAAGYLYLNQKLDKLSYTPSGA